ncbi:MAG: winged helix DNA-binding domain-containing protein [Beutenbergiaceae bacterium]
MPGGDVLDERALLVTRLDRQRLLKRQQLSVTEAVGYLCALQSQEPVSPYLALWNRIEGFHADQLDEAYHRRDLVKATLMRMTLHTVTAGDYPAFRAAVRESLRGTRWGDRRFAEAGLSQVQIDDLTTDVQDWLSVPRTSAEIIELLARSHGDAAGSLWWALRSTAPIHHVPADDAAWTFSRRPRFGYRDYTECDPEHGTHALVLSYLKAFGPAARPDIARFTKLPVTVIGRSLQHLDAAGLVRTVTGPDGKPRLDATDAHLADPDQEIEPRLMTMWDSYVMAYADGSVVPAEYKKIVTRINGDQLPTLLIDGRVAGLWRVIDGHVEATAFRRLSRSTWAALTDQATALLGFLNERDHAPWARFHHWWDKGIPGDRVRRLG